MTQLEFLEDTINHYNIGNRCSNDLTCKYSPVTLGLVGKSEGCAIGRHLPPEVALWIDNEYPSGVGIYGLLLEEKDLLPDWMKIMNRDFLRAVQYLHDEPSYWDEGGLSYAGETKVVEIKHVYL